MSNFLRRVYRKLGYLVKGRFYKVSLFWIVIFLLIFIAIGFLVGDRIGFDRVLRLKKAQEQGLSEDAKLKKLYPALTQGETPTVFTGWQSYTWKTFGVNLSYPHSWTIEDKTDHLILTTPDGNYKLLVEMSADNKSINLKPELPEVGQMKDAGKISVLGTEIEKSRLVNGDKSIAYAYPLQAVAIKGNSFQAVFISTKNANVADLELLDYRAIAEKVLNSFEFSK